MREEEPSPVIKALHSHGLDFVAIHHYMIESRPMIIFLHLWGNGPGDKLATGFKAALDQLGKGRVTTKTERHASSAAEDAK